MNWQKLVQVILTASLIFVFSEAVLCCAPVQGGSGGDTHAAAVATLQAYHWPAVGLGLGVLVLFLMRRFEILLPLQFNDGRHVPRELLTAATIGPDCEPVGAFGVKVVLGVVAACFVGQLAFWIVERRRAKSA